MPKPIRRVIKKGCHGESHVRENQKGCLLKRGGVGGDGDGEVEARASRRAGAGSKDGQMEEGREPRPGAGRKREE